MKKQFLILVVLILFTAAHSFAQYGPSKGKSDLDFVGWIGRYINLPASANNCNAEKSNVFCGYFSGNVDNVPDIPFYCMNLCVGFNMGDSIVDSTSTIADAIYITNNFFPSQTNVLPDENDEACAVQLAIWYFRNNIIIDSVTINNTLNDQNIKARAMDIVNETITNSSGSVHKITIQINPAANPDDFYVRTLDTAGNPVAVNGIELTITGGGTLSTYNVNTDVTGNSPDVIVTGPNNLSIITATGLVQIPAGFTYSGLNSIAQLFVKAITTTGLRSASITWGALPVEISVFNSQVRNRNVILSWRTILENNNSGFDIERSIAGSSQWTKAGYQQGSGTSNTSHDYSFTDRNLSSGKYNYRLKQTDYNGNFEYHYLSGEVVIGTPSEFSLSQNYPNPFNPYTTINFELPAEGFVTLKIYNTAGKEAASLVNEKRPAGYYSVSFNASALSSGVYYYRLESGGISRIMKMALIK